MKLLVLFLAILFFISGCVLPESVKLGDQSLQTENYIDAVKHYETGLSQATDKSSRETINNKLATAKTLLVDEYLAKADAALTSGQTDRLAALDRASVILNQVVQWDDAEQRISADLTRYSDEKQSIITLTKQHGEEYQLLIRQYRFEDALEEVEKGLSLDPDNRELLQAKLTVLKLMKDYIEMQDALARKSLQEAMEKFQILVNDAPVELTFDDVPQRPAFIDLIQEKSALLQNENKWWEAYTFLSKWQVAELEPDLQLVRTEGATWYLQKAQTAMRNDHLYKSYLLIERAAQLDGAYPDIFNLHRITGDKVDISMQSNIAVASFGTPSYDPDAGRQFSDSLISYLYEVFPYGINILEREKIDLVKDEKGAGEEDLAQILGVDLMVTGSVSLFKVEKNIDERKATVKIKTNEEIDYEKMLSLFGSNRENWPKLESQMPKKITYESIRYTKGKADLKGFAKVSVRIFDTNKGAIAFVKDYEANINHSSDFQDEVLDADIQYRPIKLPTETEAKEEMRKEIVIQIGKVVQSSFENREVRFRNQARFFIGRKELKQALRPIAEGYWYCKRSQQEKEPACIELRELAAQLLP